MAGKRGGLHSYTVQEAQNSSMGQVGSVYLDTDGIGTFTGVTPGFDSVNEFDYPTRYGKINKLFGKLGQPQ